MNSEKLNELKMDKIKIIHETTKFLYYNNYLERCVFSLDIFYK
jgi:hypothetical protein